MGPPLLFLSPVFDDGLPLAAFVGCGSDGMSMVA